MNDEKSRPKAAPETPAKVSADKVTSTVAEMQRRRTASRRLLALPDGRRDVLDRLAAPPLSLEGSRAAWRHLHDLRLDNDDTVGTLMLAGLTR